MAYDFGQIREGLSADVIVVGGGPAGMCAAIAAAREGVSVLLIEKGGACGGMATTGMVGPFMTCYDSKGENMIIRGIFEEIVDRMVEKGFAIHPSEVRQGTGFTSWIKIGHDHVTPFEPEGLKLVMDEMLTEAGIKIMYHTNFLRAVMDGDTITGVLVSSKRGIERIDGKVIIDCTGDGDVAVTAGVPYEMGNQELGLIQPVTMFFHICNTDEEKMEADIQANINNFYRKNGVNYRSFHWRVAEAVSNGEWEVDGKPFNRVALGLFRMPKPDEWCVNVSRITGIDATDPESLTKAEIEGRKQVQMIFNMIRKYVPGCENAKIKASGSHVGVRETRHIAGDYRLVAEDLLQGKVPEDAILLAANSVDVHGRFGPASNEYTPITGDYYGVPYRSLIAKGVKNLLLAGRNVSADSTAAGAIRVMPPCMGMGQASGTAAALAVKKGVTPREVDAQELRAVLKANGAHL
jgi:hypothetical protein